MSSSTASSLLRSARRITSATSTFVSRPRLFHTTSPKMVVKPVNSKAEWDAVLAEGKPVLVDFHAVWCGPCKAISPILEKHSEDAAFSGITFVKVDVDQVPDVSAELGVRAMPTFMLFKNGEKVEELLGANPPGLQKLLQKGVEA